MDSVLAIHRAMEGAPRITLQGGEDLVAEARPKDTSDSFEDTKKQAWWHSKNTCLRSFLPFPRAMAFLLFAWILLFNHQDSLQTLLSWGRQVFSDHERYRHLYICLEMLLSAHHGFLHDGAPVGGAGADGVVHGGQMAFPTRSLPMMIRRGLRPLLPSFLWTYGCLWFLHSNPQPSDSLWR